jgi:pimeloyl-ACP methyl ester carboxylesterase
MMCNVRAKMFGIDLNLNVWFPENLDSPLPIVIFFTGMSSIIPSAYYSNLLSQISYKNNGSIVVAWDGSGAASPFNHNITVMHAEKIFNFVKDGSLQAAILNLTMKQLKIDMSKLIWAGHSSGCQITVLMNARHAGSAMILLDPVDSDPFNKTVSVVIPENTIDFNKPLLVIVSGFGEVPAIKFLGLRFPACCPVIIV